MPRKPISEAVQTKILLKSRRRCCLCFWLSGEDEVKKGQLAHLDGDNENPGEENLVFLCLEDHDEFDSTPRLSKGLREREVQQWRNELYKEMEYRFRTTRRHNADLSLVRLVRTHESTEYNNYCAQIRLRNFGDTEIRSPTISLNLTKMLYGEPGWDENVRTTHASTKQIASDLFEPNGRIATLTPVPILLRDHSVDFYTLALYFGGRQDGTLLTVPYRIDGEGMAPISGELKFNRASADGELVPVGHLVTEGVATVPRR